MYMTVEKLPYYCGGDLDAVDLIMGMWSLCEVWDDAVDRDKHKPEKAVNAAFEYALFGLHENAVYRRHPGLKLALRTAVINWKTANELEKTGEREQLVTAFALRCSPFDFFLAVIQCVAGVERAQEAALAWRGDTTDTFSSYLAEHTKG
jgi:hypothetical protein